MSTVLVTGVAGFIGSDFVRYWRAVHPGDRVVALDALTYAGVRESLNGLDGQLLDGVEFVHGSIGNIDLVEHLLRTYSVDVVVNVAAESHNSLAILRPGDFFATNVTVIQGLLGWAPAVEWNDGIADAAAWHAAKKAWWRPLLGRSAVVEGAGAVWGVA